MLYETGPRCVPTYLLCQGLPALVVVLLRVQPHAHLDPEFVGETQGVRQGRVVVQYVVETPADL